MNHLLINGDCLDVLSNLDRQWHCVMADPFDNIGLRYNEFKDKVPDAEYRRLLWRWMETFTQKAPIIWVSFNARWTFAMGKVFDAIDQNADWEAKPCVQVFTFGQHNQRDLGNNHRPLWRLRRTDAPIYPDAIRVPSWRQLNGDKRADPRGRVPGDVFDFTRVTGNSKQRRKWHPTQLNEELVERVVRFSTIEGDSVLDPFGGTGTTLRVCQPLNRPCTLIEFDNDYCEKIKEEHPNLKFIRF